ncbi:transposase [Rhizobium ruizarguesonis]
MRGLIFTRVPFLTPGIVNDRKVAELCIAAMPPSAELVADKGYHGQALREWLQARVTQPVIPRRKNRKIRILLRPYSEIITPLPWPAFAPPISKRYRDTEEARDLQIAPGQKFKSRLDRR